MTEQDYIIHLFKEENDMLKEGIETLKNKIEVLKSKLENANHNWEKLKQYLINTIQSKNNSPKYYKLNDVLEKMEEFERSNYD